MFHPTAVDRGTPHAVRTFVSRVLDGYLREVHAMLRLPRPEIQIDAGCTFAISAVLMNVISGVSVVLYEPPPGRTNIRRKFEGALATFYPWETEPTGAINNAAEGATVLYQTFRNPMAHAFGFQEPEPQGRMSITRLGGVSEDDLEQIETSNERPTATLQHAPTLRRVGAAQAIELNVEAFYWGVRKLLRCLTADTGRMRNAQAFLRMLKKRAKGRQR